MRQLIVTEEMKAPPSPGQRLRLNPLSLRQRCSPQSVGLPRLLPVSTPGELLFFGNNLSPVGRWDVLEIALGTPSPFRLGYDLEPVSSPSRPSAWR